MHTFRRLASCALALCLLIAAAADARAAWFFGGGDAAATETPSPSPEPTPAPRATEEKATLRVYLKSLGDPVSLGITTDGVYTVENDPGYRFARGASLELAADGGSVLMTCGGLTIDMGSSVTFTRQKAAEGENNGLILHETRSEALFEGDLRVSAKDGALVPVLTIDIEDYLLGVVPYEMSDSFPIEALKAQAVAARTYAMSRKYNREFREYDVVDTTADQVYKGMNPLHENAVIAVEETRGVVETYKGVYATCYFAASNGGQTALPGQVWGYDGDYGYLDVRDDPYDVENASSVVKCLEISADGARLDAGIADRIRAALAEQMAALGLSEEKADITIVSVDGIEPVEPKTEGTRMFKTLRFTVTAKGVREPDAEGGARETVTVDQPLTADIDFYADLKKNYDLKINSADLEIVSVAAETDETTQKPVSFAVEARRYGHGVGMSQRGAQQMAGAHGMTWLAILRFYYPGGELCRMDYARDELVALDALPESVGAARAKPTPKPTPAPLPALADGEYYATVTLGSKSSTLNVREKAGTDARIVAVVDHGSRLIVTEETGDGWAHIKTAEVDGYVSTDYLQRED